LTQVSRTLFASFLIDQRPSNDPLAARAAKRLRELGFKIWSVEVQRGEKLERVVSGGGGMNVADALTQKYFEIPEEFELVTAEAAEAIYSAADEGSRRVRVKGGVTF
jgi:hypothetical protein